MQRIPLKRMGGAIATAIVALALIGCRGASGQNGANGTNGTNGTNGSNGSPGATYTIDASKLTPAEWSGLSLSGQVTSVTTSGAPVVNFKIAESHGVPVKGLGFIGKNPASDPYNVYLNMAFSIAKLVPGTNGSPSKWVSYIVTSNPTVAAPTTYVPTRPTTDNIGTLTDNGDGSYRYTFRRDITQTKSQLDAYTYTGNNIKADLGDLTYDASLTHRLTVYVGGTAWGTGSNTADRSNSGVPSVAILNPANFLYDFIPATGAPVTTANEQREITSVDKCFTCHAKFEFHGSGRQDTRYCVVCHNDQRKYGRAEATVSATTVSGDAGKIAGRAQGDMPNFIHRIHMGEELQKTGYAYGGVDYNDITYPQDHRNCVKCHTASTATPQGDNWFNKPNRVACGGCHDTANWETGERHGVNNEGGPQLSDQNCVQCHDSAAIKADHIPQVAPDPAYLPGSHTNGAYVAAYPGNLPAGANVVTWDLNSVTINASSKPVFKFRIMKNGTPVVLDAATKPELMAGYVGGPSVYLAMALPQDGINTPADWNATVSGYMRNIWNGTATGTGAGTITGPDSSGYYLLTLTGVTIPTNALHMTGGIGYTYGYSTPPLTQTNVPGYPYNPTTLMGGVSVPAPNVSKLVSGTLPSAYAAQTARRAIVTTAKCNDCHGKLGVFTASVFHAGERNDSPTCVFCHNTDRVNSGWGVNIKDAVHAIHAGAKRENKFSWEASAGDKYWTITYPGVLNNCEACHVPGSYDFGIAANAGEVPNLLWTTVATGTVPNPVNVVVTGNEPIPGTYWSPFVTAGAVYGSGFSFSAGSGATTQAAPTTLVNSPYVAACSTCHDSDIAIAHMKANGGAFYEARSTAFSKQEQCFLCHSSGKVADVKLVHMDFK